MSVDARAAASLSSRGDASSVPVLSAERIQKTFANGVRALEKVSLDVRRGEFVSLLGPSGCGKSTLLRLFAGLEKPTAGRLAWWGDVAIGARRSGRHFSMVFQEATLLPWTSVLGNVRLPLDLASIPKREGDAKSLASLESVGLAGFHRAYPRELSGGMRMRAAIARALVTEPNLLLMDEPFGALDEFTRNRLDADLHRLWAARDLTVLFVTHSIYEAVFLSSRIVVMGTNPGRILADLDLSDVVERDQDFRVSSRFIATCQELSRLLAAAHETPFAREERPS